MTAPASPIAARVVGDRSRQAMLALDEGEWAERVERLERATLNGSLTERTGLLVQIAINATVTGLSREPLRTWVRRALGRGVPREEIAAVFKLCAVIGIHSMAQAIPILDVQAGSPAGERVPPRIAAMRSSGTYNEKWNAMLSRDADWLDAFLAVGYADETRVLLGEQTFELLCIAIDATVTHLYNPGTERHVEAALACGVTPEEIFEVLKLVSIQGLQSIDTGMTVLDEEESYMSA